MESMSYDVPELQKKWKSIAENWFSMNHKEVCLELLLTNGYELLDLHPKFHDKLKKNKNTLDNIVCQEVPAGCRIRFRKVGKCQGHRAIYGLCV